MTTLYKKSRSSKKVCEEKFCCLTEGAEGDLVCEQCKTNQCQACEAAIHKSKPHFEFHDRRPLKPPPYEELCQIASVDDSECPGKNFADLRCYTCQRNFCFKCFDCYHKKYIKKQQHKKTSIKEYNKEKLERELLERAEAIKPISPLASGDDSLTFISCPQNFDSDDGMSYASFHSDKSQLSGSIPDLCFPVEKELEMQSVTKALEESMIDEHYENCHSFMLADEQENLMVKDNEDFVLKLECDSNALVKVVSIFGNTGDGKSFTLNHTFFGGKEVFKTSASQESCTIGAWAAYDNINSAIIIDTEGLLGVTVNQNQRTRLLLKLLAISDVVIYRTRAERLHNDMFYFLGDASKAYSRHFTEELRSVSKRLNMSLDITNLSPAVIIFHETHNTNPLGREQEEPSSTIILRERFKELECTMEFSDIKYVGTKTGINKATDFENLLKTVQELLNNNSIRAPRKPEVVYRTLQALNEKFSGEIEKSAYDTFPDQYFTCRAKCLSCGVRCCRSMNHEADEINHEANKDDKCQFQHQYENQVFNCKKCYRSGKNAHVVLKTAESKDSAFIGVVKNIWAGDVLECPNCGVIYRSRQFWYSNPEIESVVQMEVIHIWPGQSICRQGAHNAARKVLDGINVVANSLASASSVPAKAVSNWMTDQVAPAYWVPNTKIKKCYKCEKELSNEQKHHCRACGQGFCDDCTSYQRAVPDRGWTSEVRVCENCFNYEMSDSTSSTGSDTQVTARKVTETVGQTLGLMANMLSIPFDMIKDSARPEYWVPDSQIKNCCVCEQTFGQKLAIHHCRACGQGVCENCSPNKRPVPMRGWDYPVRVCTKCERKDKL
ncbi:hypothetical protein CHS0354_040164 [Potamilus streckersoni]|uniref:Zinc finger FYVE domain-containing protein 1 n=1 Tax=Potamilus streckersoni TaxID=2493646 RepID=A0AAE0SSQ4_9BIVA|nr:hypothetical protein CHS0354_040164 [Potamilus streckersoni]